MNKVKNAKSESVSTGDLTLFTNFRFPKNNEDVRSKWLNACQLTENELSPAMIVCSKHFQENDFFHSKRGGRVEQRLKKKVIPSLFLQ